MADDILDCKGLRCPQPILKIALKLQTLPKGATLEVHSDCRNFPPQLREWCEATKRLLISLTETDKHFVALLRA